MTLLILALANPRKAGGTQAAQRQGIDLMIALDVSKKHAGQGYQSIQARQG